MDPRFEILVEIFKITAIAGCAYTIAKLAGLSIVMLSLELN